MKISFSPPRSPPYNTCVIQALSFSGGLVSIYVCLSFILCLILLFFSLSNVTVGTFSPFLLFFNPNLQFLSTLPSLLPSSVLLTAPCSLFFFHPYPISAFV